MGAWGTAIFSDDLASDVRREYNLLISFGKDNEETEEMLISYYRDILDKNNPDENVFWFALALSEWKKGRLSERTKSKAIYFLENGNDLERWKYQGNEKKYQKRVQVLQEFKETILSPMPEKKNVRKPTVHHCPWKVGSLLAYRIIANKSLSTHPCFKKYALLRVLKVYKNPVSVVAPAECYNESMLIGLYGWIGDEIPEPEIVDGLDYIPISNQVIKMPPNPLDFSILEALPEESRNTIKEGLESFFSGRTETCVILDWISSKDAVGDITYLGCDESYVNYTPEFFNISKTSYTLTHFKAFDITLTKRLEKYL